MVENITSYCKYHALLALRNTRRRPVQRGAAQSINEFINLFINQAINFNQLIDPPPPLPTTPLTTSVHLSVRPSVSVESAFCLSVNLSLFVPSSACHPVVPCSCHVYDDSVRIPSILVTCWSK